MKTIKITLVLALVFGMCFTGHSQRRSKKTDSASPISVISADEFENQGRVNIEDIIPKQTIGVAVGAGFTQDFDETTFCVSAEYLRRIHISETNKGWYAGVEATYENSSFNDFKSNRFVGGPKLQYNLPITPSQETQFTAGLMTNYTTGTNDFSGFEETFNGFIGCIYGGINIRVNEDWSVGGQFPILVYESLTFEPESGGEFKVDGTSLLVNKSNPLKIFVRKRF